MLQRKYQGIACLLIRKPIQRWRIKSLVNYLSSISFISYPSLGRICYIISVKESQTGDRMLKVVFSLLFMKHPSTGQGVNVNNIWLLVTSRNKTNAVTLRARWRRIRKVVNGRANMLSHSYLLFILGSSWFINY